MEIKSKKTIGMCEILDRFIKLSQSHSMIPGSSVNTWYSIKEPRQWIEYETSLKETTMNEAKHDPIDDVKFNKTDSAIRREINALADLLIRKNRDYGNAAVSESPLCPELDSSTAILVRMGDKIKRLENLASVKETQVDESFEDTVRDLAGYCVLYLASKSVRNSYQGD